MKLAMNKVTKAEEQKKMMNTVWVLILQGHRRTTDELEDKIDGIGEHTSNDPEP